MHLIKTALVAGLAALTLTAAAEAATYPSPAFDFAHPGSPHASCCTAGLYSPTGGNLDRPMLVIYASFTDTPFPGGMPASTAASRFFGGFPSVRDYFLDEGGVDLSPGRGVRRNRERRRRPGEHREQQGRLRRARDRRPEQAAPPGRRPVRELRRVRHQRRRHAHERGARRRSDSTPTPTRCRPAAARRAGTTPSRSTARRSRWRWPSTAPTRT